MSDADSRRAGCKLPQRRQCGSIAVLAALLTTGCGSSSTPAKPLSPADLSPASCASSDNPERGLQGDATAETVNCGLSLLSLTRLPPSSSLGVSAVGGSATGAGHCGYIRRPGAAPYTGENIYAFDLSDPRSPVPTQNVPSVGGSESMRGRTFIDTSTSPPTTRSIAVSGRGVYEIGDPGCSLVMLGEIQWPSLGAQAGAFIQASTSHEIAISHDGKRVYTGLGFGEADISDLPAAATADGTKMWTAKNWQCDMNYQSGYLPVPPEASTCQGSAQPDIPRQYSHSSDDNLEGTRWYGANQNGDGVAGLPGSNLELPTMRVVDISDPTQITILGKLDNFPGHSMNWWRDDHGREFILGANETISGHADSCKPYPRDTSLGTNLDAYIAEVTNDALDQVTYDAYRANPALTMAINRPENCKAAKASGAVAGITEYSIFNKQYPDGHTVAFVMIEYAGPSTGGAGLRVFDLKDGHHPKEVAYYNDNQGYVHSAQFYYSEEHGYIIASATNGLQVLYVEPQVITALGLPQPTDPHYSAGYPSP